MTIEEKKARYRELCHAMQSGVAFVMQHEPGETTPKHLRVGVNSALLDSSATARLLMQKGVFTEDEYYDALIEVFEEEVDRYQARIRNRIGYDGITLA